METFKDIVGYEGLYQISNHGRVKSLKSKIVLKPSGVNYKIILLWKGGVMKAFNIHRLVAQHFIPNPENKPEVNHKDGNKLNNHVDNLEWNTRKENQIHAFKTGLNIPQCGTNRYCSKLTDDNVREIRKLKGKMTQRKIGEIYGVGKTTIYKIINNQSWTHVK